MLAFLYLAHYLKHVQTYLLFKLYLTERKKIYALPTTVYKIQKITIDTSQCYLLKNISHKDFSLIHINFIFRFYFVKKTFQMATLKLHHIQQ